MGEGNSGKSSLINHLLGRSVANVHFLPRTWRTDLYCRVKTEADEHALLRRASEAPSLRMSREEARAAGAEQEARLQAHGREARAAQGHPCQPPAAPAAPGYYVELPPEVKALPPDFSAAPAVAGREVVDPATLDAVGYQYAPPVSQ